MYVKTNRMHGCCETVVHLLLKRSYGKRIYDCNRRMKMRAPWMLNGIFVTTDRNKNATLAKKRMRAWIFVRKSVSLRHVIVG